MVANKTMPVTVPGVVPDVALVDAVAVRLDRDKDRFLAADPWTPVEGHTAYCRDALAVLVAEIVTEHTAAVRAERDAADDAVLELLHDLEGGGR